MDNAAAKNFVVTRRHAYYVFVLLFLLYVFNYIDRIIISSLIPYLKAEWTLTDYQLGWLASIVTLMMTVFVFPISFLVDRWSRKKAIGTMAIVWGVASAACALARNFTELSVLRSFVGIAEAAYTAGGFAMIAAYFPENKRSTMSGLFSMAIPLGAALGMALGGIIAQSLGWRYSFGIMAMPGLIVAVLFFYVKDYKTVEIRKEVKQGARVVTQKMSLRDIVERILKTPSVLYTYVGYMTNAFVTTGLMVWLPTFYNRVEGLPMNKASMKGATIMLLVIVGAPLGGIITDWGWKYRRAARMSVPALTSLASAILLAAALLVDHRYQYILFLLFGFVSPMYVAGGAAVTQDVVHPGLRAISYGINQFFMMLIGYSLSPIIIGAISDRYDLITAFKILPVFCIIAAVAFFIGHFYYERDLNKVERVTLKAQ